MQVESYRRDRPDCPGSAAQHGAHRDRAIVAKVGRLTPTAARCTGAGRRRRSDPRADPADRRTVSDGWGRQAIEARWGCRPSSRAGHAEQSPRGHTRPAAGPQPSSGLKPPRSTWGSRWNQTPLSTTDRRCRPTRPTTRLPRRGRRFAGRRAEKARLQDFVEHASRGSGHQEGNCVRSGVSSARASRSRRPLPEPS